MADILGTLEGERIAASLGIRSDDFRIVTYEFCADWYRVTDRPTLIRLNPVEVDSGAE